MAKWTKTVIVLKQHVKSRNGGGIGREGYVDERGQIAIPPKDGRKLKEWKQKMGVP